MAKLWLIFKCLSLIAGCMLMIAIIVAIVETIRETFKKKSFENQIAEYTKKVLEDSLKDDKK